VPRCAHLSASLNVPAPPALFAALPSDTLLPMHHAEITDYDLGLPVPIASLEERRRRIPPDIQARLERTKASLTALLGPRLREVQLFGSYARAQFTNASDVDVLILVDRLDDADRERIVDAVVDAGSILLSPLITTGDTHNARKLPQIAGNAVRSGLPREAAIAAITRVPAEALGMGPRYGTLAPGKVANLVVWSGDPLELSTQVVELVIRGQKVSLRNRQTALLEKYRRLSR
jgi:Amidohydrolase family/Nucleotidyltransferase domain